jgi:hypothetical protein
MQGAAAAERFRLISRLSDRFSTAWLCRQLGVARSGFYDWRQRQHNPGPRAQENAAITAQIQTVFHRHRGFYGAPRVHQKLRAAGLKVGRHRVARLMRRAVLKAQTGVGSGPAATAAAGPLTALKSRATVWTMHIPNLGLMMMMMITLIRSRDQVCASTKLNIKLKDSILNQITSSLFSIINIEKNIG